MPSPFDKKKTTAVAPAGGGGAATATAEQPKASLPDAGAFSGDDPVSNDPYNAADPTGISGYKPIAFMNQLVLIHPIETGRMVTANSGKEEDGKSPYCEVDLIPLTVPDPGQNPTKEQMVARDDTYVVLNKDGDEEAFEPYSIGERLDNLRFFNKPLVAEADKALKRGTNWVLGRITYGNKKPNQSAPIILVAASDEDKAYYQQWRQSAG